MKTYALVNDDESAVVEIRSYPGALDLELIKTLENGRKKLRPVIDDLELPGADQEETFAYVIEASRVVRKNVLVPKSSVAINAGIKAQIAAIEAGQGRAVREAALGDATHLAAINAAIESLRTQLQPEP